MSDSDEEPKSNADRFSTERTEKVRRVKISETQISKKNSIFYFCALSPQPFSLPPGSFFLLTFSSLSGFEHPNEFNCMQNAFFRFFRPFLVCFFLFSFPPPPILSWAISPTNRGRTAHSPAPHKRDFEKNFDSGCALFIEFSRLWC